MKEKFDSKAEAEAHHIFIQLGATRCTSPFDLIFMDKKGEQFKAKPDYFHAGAGLFIEYKSGSLNSITHVQASRNRLESQAQYRGGEASAFDKLRYGWNQSRYKQAIVQDALSYRNFIVVFKDAPSLEEAEAYKKCGIVFCTLDSLRSYILFAKLRKACLGVGFQFEVDDYLAQVDCIT
jgi:hypothetical protein